MIVDPDRAELEVLADSHGSSDVLGPNGSSQPIRHVVGKTHRIRFILMVLTVMTGPKTSDWIISESWVTLVTTVGS